MNFYIGDSMKELDINDRNIELNDDLYSTNNGIIVPNTEKLLSEVHYLPGNLVKYLIESHG